MIEMSFSLLCWLYWPIAFISMALGFVLCMILKVKVHRFGGGEAIPKTTISEAHLTAYDKDGHIIDRAVIHPPEPVKIWAREKL